MEGDRWPKQHHHSFLIVRHTKFAPDWYFGLLKRSFWCTSGLCWRHHPSSGGVCWSESRPTRGCSAWDSNLTHIQLGRLLWAPFQANYFQGDQGDAPHVTFQATFWKSIHVREELCGHTGEGDKHFEKPRMVTRQRGASSSCPSSWPFNGIEDVSLWNDTRVLSLKS